jgi:hypothetical protein
VAVVVALAVVGTSAAAANPYLIRISKGKNMKKLILGVSMAVMSLGLVPAAHADNAAMSTEELVSYCKGTDGTFVTCEIYGQAVYDSYLVTRHPKYAKSNICVKQPAPPRKQVIEEYVAWTQANPDSAKKPAAETILRFLAGRFPCGK